MFLESTGIMHHSTWLVNYRIRFYYTNIYPEDTQDLVDPRGLIECYVLIH